MTQESAVTAQSKQPIDQTRWIVVCGSQSSLEAASARLADLSRGELYVPKMTVVRRASGRSRRRYGRVEPQYPGYAFVPETQAHVLDWLRVWHGIRHMVPTSVSYVTEVHMKCARQVETVSFMRSFADVSDSAFRRRQDQLLSAQSAPHSAQQPQTTPEEALPPLTLEVGMFVRVEVAGHAIFGTIASVDGEVAVVEARGAVLPVRVDARRCQPIDRSPAQPK